MFLWEAVNRELNMTRIRQNNKIIQHPESTSEVKGMQETVSLCDLRSTFESYYDFFSSVPVSSPRDFLRTPYLDIFKRKD